ncbi:magnesium transporter [Phycisphaeraceae bacterium D3-23]
MVQETDDKAGAVVELEALVAEGGGDAVASFLHLLPPEDTAYTVSHLTEDTRTQMLSLLSEHDAPLAADLLEHFVDEHAAEMIEQLEPDTAALIVDEMDSDEQVDVLAEMDDADAEAILAEMTPEEAHDTRKRLEYDEDTAGGLMITEYLAYHEDQPVREVTVDLQENAEQYGEYEVRYVYAIDTAGRLTGVVPLRSILLVPPTRPIVSIKVDEAMTVNVDTHLDDLHDLFDRVDLFAIPVLDQGKLVGVVQRASVQEAVGDREAEQFLRFGGIIGGEELRSMSIGSRAARRLTFLLPIMLLLLASASIIALFEGTVKELPILAAFLPVVAGICGSGGNQAVAVSIRELSLGLIGPGDFRRVLFKELVVAGLIGLGLGAVLFVIVLVWMQSLYLALLLGVSIPFVVTVSKCIGGTVPVLLKKIGVDPAMAAGPIVTTVVDLVGFFTVLMLASLMLEKLRESLGA